MGFIPAGTPQRAPEFSLTDLQGHSWGLAALRGKVVLLNFWATWCAPCRQEMPSLERLYEKFADRGDFQILTVDVQEGPKTVGDFLKVNRYHLPAVIDSDGQIAAAYSAQSIPLSVIIDANGSLIGVRLGRTDWSSPAVLRGIAALLGS